MGKKISVLLMRDDQQVRRYRLDPAWFRLVIYGILLLIAFSSIGGYLGYTFWHENDALSKEIETLRQQVQEKEIKLKSLQNMERILALHEPDELQSLLTGEKNAEQIELKHPSQVASDQVDLQTFFTKIDLNKAVVKDLSLSATEEGALRLKYHLTSKIAGDSLSGVTEIGLISRDGQFLDVKTPLEEMAFSIQNYRTFDAVFSLPQGYELADIYALRLALVTQDGTTIFSQTFPLSNIMK